MNKEEVIIPLSKVKIMWAFLGSLLFVMAGLWFLGFPEVLASRSSGREWHIMAAGLAAVLLFGVCAIYAGIKLFDQKPGLVIGPLGILDNSSGLSAGLVEWKDVEGFSAIVISGQQLLLIQVENPDSYIEKQRNPVKRRLMKMNYKLYGSPLSISSMGLKCNFEELIRLLEGHLAAHRQ